VPCILELSLPELLEAIDDTAAAINTGTLYSRSGRLLSSFPDQNEYRLPGTDSKFSACILHACDLQRPVNYRVGQLVRVPNGFEQPTR
jgi:hypothetical protein